MADEFGFPVSDAIARVERNREAFREVDVSSLPCAEWVCDSGSGDGTFLWWLLWICC